MVFQIIKTNNVQKLLKDMETVINVLHVQQIIALNVIIIIKPVKNVRIYINGTLIVSFAFLQNVKQLIVYYVGTWKPVSNVFQRGEQLKLTVYSLVRDVLTQIVIIVQLETIIVQGVNQIYVKDQICKREFVMTV